MSSLWNNAFEKQKVSRFDGTTQICGRCNLPYSKSASECEHCAHLSDNELDELRKQYNQQHSERKLQRRLTLIWAIILVVILLLVFIVLM